MFEMLVLLITEINPHSFCFVTFLFNFTREALSHRGCSTPSLVLHIWEAAVEICSKNLPWLFAAVICSRNLSWLFAARICRGYLPWVFCIRKRIQFCICEQMLFICKQTFFYMRAKLFDFLYWQCFFLLLLWQLWATVHFRENTLL